MVKTLESFDFSFQPSIDKKRIKDLATCCFIANDENVIFLGPPGVEKTHLVVALGVKAVIEGYRPYFTQALPSIAKLTRAYAENRIKDRLKFYFSLFSTDNISNNRRVSGGKKDCRKSSKDSA